MADFHSIHLVSKLPPKQSLDPADIAAAVLETVRECKQALADFCDYHEAVAAEMGAELNAQELFSAGEPNTREIDCRYARAFI